MHVKQSIQTYTQAITAVMENKTKAHIEIAPLGLCFERHV